THSWTSDEHPDPARHVRRPPSMDLEPRPDARLDSGRRRPRPRRVVGPDVREGPMGTRARRRHPPDARRARGTVLDPAAATEAAEPDARTYPLADPQGRPGA